MNNVQCKECGGPVHLAVCRGSREVISIMLRVSDQISGVISNSSVRLGAYNTACQGREKPSVFKPVYIDMCSTLYFITLNILAEGLYSINLMDM